MSKKLLKFDKHNQYEILTKQLKCVVERGWEKKQLILKNKEDECMLSITLLEYDTMWKH